MYLHGAAGMHAHEYNNEHTERFNTAPILRAFTQASYATPVRRAKTYTPTSPPIVPRPRIARPISADIVPVIRPVESGVRFKEPETDGAMSEDERSIAGSISSRTSVGGGSSRRSSTKTCTTFHIAHPAPTLTQKQRLLQIRPRILLQFQTCLLEGRPQPALDVVPSTLVVPRLTKRFPRMFRGNAQLGTNDVMVLKSEDYETNVAQPDDAESDEEGVARRDLVAVICQMRRDEGGQYGRAEIVLGDGTVWTATPLANGMHEFVTIDERGQQTVARWVRRPLRRGQDAAKTSTAQGSKFTFSFIDPTTRRHPVLATMVQSRLEIPDSYTSVSASSSRYPPMSPMRMPSTASSSSTVDDGSARERTSHTTDATMKTLIQVTAIWVALRQGWSPYFQYSDMTPPASMSCSTRGRLRSLSTTRDSGRSGPYGGTRSSTPESNPGGMSGTKDKIRRAYTVITPCASPIPSPRFDRSPVPTRSASTGTAFMQRVSARKASVSISQVPSESSDEHLRRSSKPGAVETTISVGSTPTSETMPPFTQGQYSNPWSEQQPAVTVVDKRAQRRSVSNFLPRPHINLPNLHVKRKSVAEPSAFDMQSPYPYSYAQADQGRREVEQQPHGNGYLHKFKPGRLLGLVGIFRRKD